MFSLRVLGCLGLAVACVALAMAGGCSLDVTGVAEEVDPGDAARSEASLPPKGDSGGSSKDADTDAPEDAGDAGDAGDTGDANDGGDAGGDAGSDGGDAGDADV